MKKLDINELAIIEGGSAATEVGDGFCATVGVLGWLAGPVAPYLYGACAVYTATRIIFW